MVKPKGFLANEKQAIGFCDLCACGRIVGEDGLRRRCNWGHEGDSGKNGEVRSGSDGQCEVTIESTSFI